MRRVAFVGAVALAAAALAAPASASTEQHRYVGSAFHTFATDLAGQATGVMLQGSLDFVPTSDQIILTIDDDVVSAATIAVYVSGVGQLCVPENTPTTIGGLSPGSSTTIWVEAGPHSWPYGWPCEAGGTTGVLTLTQP